MKEYSEDERTIERAIFIDRLLRFVLFPFLFAIATISYSKGILYPFIPIGIVLVAYYITAQITIVLIKRDFNPKRVYLFRLIISMVLTAIAVHYTGGIESPIFLLIGISFIISALILPLKQSIFVFTIGGIAYLAEIWLEYFRIIPHIHIVNAFTANAFQDTDYLLISSLIIVTILAGMGTLTGYLIRLLNLQVEELREAKTHTENLVKDLEETKATLEDKVKERTREIAESEDKYRSIVDKSFDGIYIIQDNVLKFVNRRFGDIMGYSAAELKDMDFRQLIAPESLELVSERGLMRLKGEKVPENYEFMGLGKDGKKMDLEAYATTINYRGRLAIQAYIRDITERKKLEEEIRNRNEELENFVHTISHDLKSPLVSMQGFASILRSEYKDKIDENGQRYLERIEKNASYMETLTRDLLELAKIGRVVGAFEKVDTSKIIEEVIGQAQHLFKEKKIELVLQNHFPIVYCDRNRILQVFENLISNSIKFMGDAESPVIEIGHTNKEEVYEFYVRDNGIGIEREYHEKIFMIFQRLQDIEGVEGTGVGLTIVKRIVENHGGNIWVVSEKGKGSTFYLTLPKKNPEGRFMG